MFARFGKFRKNGDEYEDLDRVEMDITEPDMRRYAGMDGSDSNRDVAAENGAEPDTHEGKEDFIYVFKSYFADNFVDFLLLIFHSQFYACILSFQLNKGINLSFYIHTKTYQQVTNKAIILVCLTHGDAADAKWLYVVCTGASVILFRNYMM